jgi:hypothetical protein
MSFNIIHIMHFSNVTAKLLVALFIVIVVGAPSPSQKDKAEVIIAAAAAADSMVHSSSAQHHMNKDNGATTVNSSRSDAGILNFCRVLQSSSTPACAQEYVV